MPPSAGSVTPARRPRDDDESDLESSMNDTSSQRSIASKRPRLAPSTDGNGDAGDEEIDDDNEAALPTQNGDEHGHLGDLESPSQNGDLLPDSFRRSPRDQRSRLPASEIRKHQPGSIVRVKLIDFVTYTHAEFQPGPNLNMIIGPNGTGKSTLVCAICLGLGWATSHLGRAKDLGEFVKHGARKAEIEIELAADPTRHRKNPIITTRITKERSKSDYFVDGKKSTRKGVQELARSFSIQVDNLCQFLPQDRVVEFAALSPVDLLTQTQRAAAPPSMSEWHEQLKEMRKSQKRRELEQQSLTEMVKALESRQRLQEPDVLRLRERIKLKDRIAAMEKFRPFPEYMDTRRRYKAAKARRNEAKQELTVLKTRARPNLEAADRKQKYLERISATMQRWQNSVNRGETEVADTSKKLKDLEAEMDAYTREIKAEVNNVRSTKERLPQLEQDVGGIEQAKMNPPDEFDAAAMNAQIREKTRLIREIDEKMRDITARVESHAAQVRQREQLVREKEEEKQNLRSQAGQQANKLKHASNDAWRAWQWIQNNKSAFQGIVYGPPILECTLTDPKHAPAVESMITDGDKLSFTVTSEADLKTLLDNVSKQRLHDVNIRVSLQPLAAYQPSVSEDRLRQLNLDRWLLDFIKGPEPVLAMLCDNRSIHQMAYTTRDITDQQFNAIKQSPIGSWVTPKLTYQVTRRREYGEAGVSTRSQALKTPRFFTDVPVDLQLEHEINRNIAEVEAEIKELEQRKTDLASEGTAVRVEHKRLFKERQAIEEAKKTKQRAWSEFQGLSVKLGAAQDKVKAAKDAIHGHRERVRAIADRADKSSTDKAQLTVDYAIAVDALRGLRLQLLTAEIMQIEAQSDVTQLLAQHADEARLLGERETEVEILSQEAAKLHDAALKLAETCGEIVENMTDIEEEVHFLLRGRQEDENGEEVTDAENCWTPDQLETEIQSTQARLEMVHGGGGQSTIQEFEKRGNEIEQKRTNLADLESTLDEIGKKIDEVRGQWEPQLDRLVGQISEAFKDNFEKINCVGEVAVHKDDDFEQWAIQIRVKFRENEQLSVLDSHRQSGGERAVSTIFYLMALQSLARAPFRVVDEINQGMDPRNERLVHSRMVDIACGVAEDGRQGSQYFLITPKLLSGLKYHPDMKVHCIASGEHMPTDHRDLDFGALAEEALALRSVRAAG